MTLPLVFGAAASCVPRSAAQLTVFDPANFQQNLLSATRALEQITNQVRVLQNQVLMIARMDQNLVRLGVNYPRGPLAWANELGPANILGILEHLQRFTGEDRYRPCPLLRRLVLAGAPFPGEAAR